MALKLSSEVVEGVVRLKPDWLRPNRRRRDVTDALLTTIAGYAAEKRAQGLPEGKGTTLLASGSIEIEFRNRMREALGLYDVLIGRLTVELRDWVLKARGRTREYPWGNLTAEGEWLWVIPKILPLDSWATPRSEPVYVLTPEEFMKPLRISIRGPRGSGKSSLAYSVAQHLREQGFDAVVEDKEEKPQKPEVYERRLASVSDVMKKRGQKIIVEAVQTPREPVTRNT